ncbi:MAG: hypothetical protein ACI39C_02830 [Dietzia sp.]
MVKSSSTAAVAAATGRPWGEWVELLDREGARELKHTAIARLTLHHMPEPVEQREWWAQHAAVAYEQHAGLRVPGQTCTGDFQLSTSRTVAGDKDSALQAWIELVAGREEFGGIPVDGEASVTRSEKWRYWRVPLADGTRVALNFSDKTAGKSGQKAAVGLVHTKLDSAEAIDYWRPVWKELLGQLS